MKASPAQNNRFWTAVPLALIVLVIIAAFAGGIIFAVYGIVTAVAFGSAMISLIIFGASFIAIGLGLGFIVLFKKYYAYYLKKAAAVAESDRESKSAVYDGKKPLKSYFTLTNISLAVVLLGAIFTVISAALGCLDRDKWNAAMRPFRLEHGYFADINEFDIQQSVDGINGSDLPLTRVECDMRDKQVEVLYVTDAQTNGNIRIFTYYRFDGQLNVSRNGNRLLIVEKERGPIVRDALAKMLFFVTDVMSNYPPEGKIVIEIPQSYADKIEVVNVNSSN